MTEPLNPAVKSELARIGMAIAQRVGEVIPSLNLVKETWCERAAIREYLGGYTRATAETAALVDTCSVLGVRYA